MKNIKKLKVKNSEFITLQVFNDFPDGNLYIAEAQKNIPFEIKRVYFINKLANSSAERGKHAHKKLKQIIFCINGSFVMHLDDGVNKQKILLNNPSCGILLGSKVWHQMGNFSYDCVILVFADDIYKADDYIRDYNEFLKFVRKK